jgi:hypothetical protein
VFDFGRNPRVYVISGAVLLVSKLLGLSRTFDGDCATRRPNDRKSRQNGGLLCELAVVDHQKCGRALKGHNFFGPAGTT